MGGTGKTKENIHTNWDFEFWCESNGLADPIYALRGRIVHEALKMENKNLWKRVEKHLLGCVVRARLADPHGLWLYDACKCVLNGVHRIGLHKRIRD